MQQRRERYRRRCWTTPLANGSQWAYMTGMKKRIADWLEKVSVASLAVGLFQDKLYGLPIAALCLAMSLYLTYMERDQ